MVLRCERPGAVQEEGKRQAWGGFSLKMLMGHWVRRAVALPVAWGDFWWPATEVPGPAKKGLTWARSSYSRSLRIHYRGDRVEAFAVSIVAPSLAAPVAVEWRFTNRFSYIQILFRVQYFYCLIA